MPPDLKQTFDKLKHEVVRLHARWKIYRQLFGHSQKRVDLLNECASFCFFVMDNVLFADVQLGLSKLTDPAKKGGHETLSLEQLLLGVQKMKDYALASSLRQTLGKPRDTCKDVRRRRNKRLAHLDLDTAPHVATPLRGISRQLIEDALALVRQFMNEVEAHYCQAPTSYQHVLATGDREVLIALLKSGAR